MTDDIEGLRAQVVTLERLLADRDLQVRATYVDLEHALSNLNQRAQELARTERACSQQRGILHSILDSMSDGVAVADEHGRMVLFNRAAERILGLTATGSTPEDWTGQYGCFLPDTVTPFPAESMPLVRSLRGEMVDDGEMFIRNPHIPEGIWLSVNARPLLDADLVCRGGVAVFRDITLRKQLDLRNLLQHAVARILAEGGAWHETCERLLAAVGTDLDWLIGSFWEVDPVAQKLSCRATWQSADLTTRESHQRSEDATYVLGQGIPGQVWAERRAIWRTHRSPTADWDGGGLHTTFAFPIQTGTQVLGVLEFLGCKQYPHDPELIPLCRGLGESIGLFAQRKRTEDALRDSEALYQSLVDSLPLYVFCKDHEGRFTFTNQRFAETLGRPTTEIVGRSDADFYPVDLAAKYRRDDLRVMERRKLFEDVEQYCQPDGEKKYVQVWKVPVFDTRNRVVGIQGVFWDVTDRRKAEDALKSTAAELVRSNRDLEQFAYIASHDLQEPLRMVSSYCQLLERRYGTVLKGDGLEFLAFAVDGAKRMQGLINDLLSYSRIGMQRKPLRPVSAAAAATRAVANLQATVAEKGAEITLGELPTVLADETLLVQLFQNLIGNAIKFHGAAPPRVEIRAHGEGQEWVFSVKDNGIGIEPQYQERVFAIFQRLHGRGEYPGTGIGLAICKRIVERHGGRIQVESAPGQGSTFSFTLPRPEDPSR